MKNFLPNECCNRSPLRKSFFLKLDTQFEDVGSHGTKVFIYNLWMNDDGLLELDFDDDDEVIMILLVMLLALLDAQPFIDLIVQP